MLCGVGVFVCMGVMEHKVSGTGTVRAFCPKWLCVCWYHYVGPSASDSRGGMTWHTMQGL